MTDGTDTGKILKRYWGFDSFRPMQERIIRSVLDGHDTLALLPTGSWSKVETKTFAPFPFVLSQPMRRGVPLFPRRESAAGGRGRRSGAEGPFLYRTFS